MSFDAQRLYELLPAVHRIRDEQNGRPLAGLLAIIADQVGGIEENLAQLYDDQFIETCDEWVVPYIGELIGIPPPTAMRSYHFVCQRERPANSQQPEA